MRPEAFDHYRIGRLETPLLALEPLQASHAAELFEALQDPTLYQFIPQNPPASAASLAERYAGLEQRFSPDRKELWLNWVLRKEGAAAGLVQATCNAQSQAFVAYEIFVRHRRQGLARHAVTMMLNHLTQSRLAATALAYVDTRNQASIATLESLKFSRRRFLKGADYFKGQVSDEYEYERPLSANF